MVIKFTTNSWEEYQYWEENDSAIIIKINALIENIITDPFHGIGKPEPLKHDLKGFWSRRITNEHRLVYKVTGTKGDDQMCTIIQCRFHYDDN
jgi:toxin YoeB